MAKIWCQQYDRLFKSWNIFLQFRSKYLEDNGLVKFITCFCDQEVLSTSAAEISDYDKGQTIFPLCFPNTNEQVMQRYVPYV